jgi:predicted nucleic acid-binding protein
MTYLLDVNSLIALGVLEHEFHRRVASWVAGLAQNGVPELATCSITELGFVRVLSQAESYRCSVTEAKELLRTLKAGEIAPSAFISDELGVSRLPQWVKHPKQITDGHLLELANAHGAQLATLDERINGAYLIPSNR